MKLKYLFFICFLILLFIFVNDIYAQTDQFQENISSNIVKDALDAKDFRLKGDYDSAIRILKQIIQVNPNYYFAYYELALSQAQKGLYEESIITFEDGKRIKERENISDASFYNSIGWVYFLKGDYYNAKNNLNKTIESGETISVETNRKVLNNLGILYFTLGEYDEAEKYFNQSLEEYNSEFAEENLDIIQRFK